MAFSGQAATQALQRVHRSRLMGLSSRQRNSNAPSQPVNASMRPPSTGSDESGATDLAGALGEHGNVQHIRHQPGHLLSAASERPGSISRRPALFICHHRHGRRLGGRAAASSRGDLGAGAHRGSSRRFRGYFTKRMGEMAPGLAAQVSEQALFLDACHHHVPARTDGLVKVLPAAAQGGMEGQVFTEARCPGPGRSAASSGAPQMSVGHVLCGWLGQATQAPREPANASPVRARNSW